MTDAEIKKALECWASGKPCEFTCECFKYATPRCDLVTAQNALDLINRLEAEASNYCNVAKAQQSVSMERHFEIKRLKEENERLKNECFCIANERDAIGDCLNTAVEEAKAEAIKDFAERLKDKAQRFHNLGINNNGYVFAVEQSSIDNLVKEMGDAE